VNRVVPVADLADNERIAGGRFAASKLSGGIVFALPSVSFAPGGAYDACHLCDGLRP